MSRQSGLSIRKPVPTSPSFGERRWLTKSTRPCFVRTVPSVFLSPVTLLTLVSCRRCIVHTGHYGAPTLDVLSRQATFVWDRLAQHNVDPVPPWSASDGVEWERLGKVRFAAAIQSPVVCRRRWAARSLCSCPGTDTCYPSLQYFREHRRFDLAEYLAS